MPEPSIQRPEVVKPPEIITERSVFACSELREITERDRFLALLLVRSGLRIGEALRFAPFMPTCIPSRQLSHELAITPRTTVDLMFMLFGVKRRFETVQAAHKGQSRVDRSLRRGGALEYREYLLERRQRGCIHRNDLRTSICVRHTFSGITRFSRCRTSNARSPNRLWKGLDQPSSFRLRHSICTPAYGSHNLTRNAMMYQTWSTDRCSVM